MTDCFLIIKAGWRYSISKEKFFFFFGCLEMRWTILPWLLLKSLLLLYSFSNQLFPKLHKDGMGFMKDCVFLECVLSLQLCLTLCNPLEYSPPGFSVHGILQARTLQWIAMPSSRGSSQPRNWTWVSYVSCIGRQVLNLGSPVSFLKEGIYY